MAVFGTVPLPLTSTFDRQLATVAWVEAAEPETTEPEAGPAGNGTKPRAAEPTPEDDQGNHF